MVYSIGGYFSSITECLNMRLLHALGLLNDATCLHIYIVYLYKSPAFRGFTVINRREVTHKPIRVGQCFHVVYQESMDNAKISV